MNDTGRSGGMLGAHVLEMTRRCCSFDRPSMSKLDLGPWRFCSWVRGHVMAVESVTCAGSRGRASQEQQGVKPGMGHAHVRNAGGANQERR